MGISFSIFDVDPRDLGPLCRHAEDRGFEIAWFGEHLIAPLDSKTRHPRSTAETAKVLYEETPLTDLAVSFGFLGGMTRRLGLGAGIFVLPMRDPIAVARAFATAQLHSNGRVLMGIGAGWLREEFDVVKVPFESRGARMDEMVELIQSLWTGEVVTHRGTIWSFENVQLWPPPTPPVPLLFGGTSDAALRRAAKYGSGWISPAKFMLEDVLRARERLERFRQEVGTSDRPFEYHIRMEGPQVAETLARYRAEGFENLSLPTADEWRRRDVSFTNEDRMALLDWYADELDLKPAPGD